MAKNIKVNKEKFLNLMKAKGVETEEVKDFLAIKKEEEKYKDKKILAACVGVGEMIGTAGFGIWDAFNGADCGITIAVLGGIGVLTTGIALLKSNPYTKVIEEEHEEIDEEYTDYKARVKRRAKKANRK